MKLNLQMGGARYNRSYCRAAIILFSFTSGGLSLAQTNNQPPAGASAQPASSTNVVNSLESGSTTNAINSTAPGSGTNVVKLAPTTVVGRLDVARSQIVPDLGATVTTLNREQIQAIPLGENAPFNEVLLRTPGMAQDSAVNGDLHLRGEHANLQYRINDVLLPEGISGFGQELDTRFVDSLRLITGSLPAQYGFRTAGIVDIHTKSGALEPGGDLTMYGGSYETIHPSFNFGGTEGKWSVFASGSYNQNELGLENTTSAATAIHDQTYQYKGFLDISYVIDDTSRISVLGSGSYSTFEIPNTPGLPAGAPTVPAGVTPIPWVTFIPGMPAFDSTDLDENQKEQAYYGVIAYQKSVGDLNLQLAAFGRNSGTHFIPDPVGDLYLNGVASDVDRTLYSGGAQFDASYALGESHTLRAGFQVLDESLSVHTITTVFPTDANGNPTFGPSAIPDDSVVHALFFGFYLQDEWKLIEDKLTLNYGARFDWYESSFDHENQPSPRVNLIYQPTKETTLHAGYARYFTPPALEFISTTSIQKFDNTSNASGTDQNDPIRSERANYFDVGVSQKVLPGLTAGVDAYYKDARNQIDDGLFGQTLILSTFNYSKGRIYGVEFTANYTHDGFSTYANLAVSQAQGFAINSAQFLFDPAKLAYSQNNWIFLDHDQTVTGSFGLSYLWRQSFGSTRVFADLLYGSGLRSDATAADGTVIPNGGTVPSYLTLNLGAAQVFKIRSKDRVMARLDLVNVTDTPYQLRNGTGVGVNAPQYGARFGIFGGLSYLF